MVTSIKETSIFYAKRLVKSYPPIFDWFKQLSRKVGNQTSIYACLKVFSDSCKDRNFTFIQIGGNDGISNDPFREFIIQYGGTGIIVEPQPQEFEKLKNNYKYVLSRPNTKKIFFERCAISYESDRANLYIVDDDFIYQNERDSESLRGVASLDRNHLINIIGSENSRYIKTIQIPCQTIEQLLSKHNFNSFDCIFMDVEGYEYEILKNISLDKIKPKLIAFESAHLGEKQAEVNSYLSRNNYQLYHFVQDTVAILE
jgi:FkbM family methyltransferase